jgi:hypothetical protein
MKSPVSMANGSTLFAFSEEGEDDESEPESQEVVLDGNGGGYSLSSKTPLRSNKATQLPPRQRFLLKSIHQQQME